MANLGIVTAERSDVLDRFFDRPTGRARSAADAAALAREHLEALEDELSDVGILDEDIELGQRGDVEARVYEAAISLGQAVIDGLTGMVISDLITDHVSPRRSELEHEAPPLDESWQQTDNPAKALAGRAAAQRERLDPLEGQPNQLFRRLYETVALAADAGEWTAWTQVAASGDDAAAGSSR